MGRTISLRLPGDEVLVARVTQRQSGPIECPVENCFRRFQSERAANTHIGKMHPEERLRECIGCGDEY